MIKNLIGEELATWKEDYDWQAAFHEAIHNMNGRCDLDLVTRVVAAVEGENEGDAWLAT